MNITRTATAATLPPDDDASKSDLFYICFEYPRGRAWCANFGWMDIDPLGVISTVFGWPAKHFCVALYHTQQSEFES